MSATTIEPTTVRSALARLSALDLMLVYIVAIYVPFVAGILLSPFDTTHVSISAIAWQHDGRSMIVWYALLTLPFLLWQIGYFLKDNRTAKRALIGPLVGGVLLTGIGIVFPCPPDGLAATLHRALCQIGSIMLIVAVSVIVARHCLNIRADHPVAALVTGLVYGTVAVTIGILFLSAGSPAVLEILSSLFFVVVLHLVNRTQALAVARAW